MHVLVDARMVGNSMHGIAHYAINLIKSLVKSGNKVSLMVRSQKTADEIAKEVGGSVLSAHVLKVPFQHPLAPIELFIFLLRLNFVRRELQPDVIHFTSFSVPWLLKASGWAKQTVVTMHDIIHLLPTKEPMSGKTIAASDLHRVFFFFFVRPALLQCSAIIAVSEWTKRTLVEHLKIPAEKITVIPNCLDDVWFSFQDAGIKRQNNVFGQNEIPFVLSVSNLKAHKNVITLIRACKILWHEGFVFRLKLVIGVNKLPAIWSVSESELKNIECHVGLSSRELRFLYQESICTVQPSQYEGYSFPVAEALASGGTVVASKCAAHAEFANSSVLTSGALVYYEPFDSDLELGNSLRKKIEDFKQGRRREPLPKDQLPDFIITQKDLGAETLAVYGAEHGPA